MIEHMDVRNLSYANYGYAGRGNVDPYTPTIGRPVDLSIRQLISENTVSSVHHKSLVLSINRCVKYSLFLKKFTLYGVFYSVFYTYVTYDMYSIILYYIFKNNICFGK